MITKEEYMARRLKLAKLLPKNSTAIIFAASEVFRNNDATYRFRQNSDFYYLTGFNEPDAILIINSAPNEASILFNKPLNQLEEQWNGKRLGQIDACESLGVDAAYSLEEIETHLPVFLSNKNAVYYDINTNKNWDNYLLKTFKQLKNQGRNTACAPLSFYDIKPILSEMRLFKSPKEISLIKKAVEISISAHKRVIKNIKNLKSEAKVEAELLYELNRLGCRNVAYESIIASGNNACTLHYVENNQPLKPDTLILIDAGGEYENYAADITRVFPINGKFNPEQRQIYELVLKAQRAGISLIKPGCIWNDIQTNIIKILTEGLVELGILIGHPDNLIKEEAYKQFYMHGSGHWLGLDVHDCGVYKINNSWRELEAGMVLTVEPGLYISNKITNIDKKWLGIGVRIEDDILVTETGYENLSKDLMVDISDIEAYMCD